MVSRQRYGGGRICWDELLKKFVERTGKFPVRGRAYTFRSRTQVEGGVNVGRDRRGNGDGRDVRDNEKFFFRPRREFIRWRRVRWNAIKSKYVFSGIIFHVTVCDKKDFTTRFAFLFYVFSCPGLCAIHSQTVVVIAPYPYIYIYLL